MVSGINQSIQGISAVLSYKRTEQIWIHPTQQLHADVNGAYNILRKALPKAFDAVGIEAVGLQPTRWRLAAVTN